jgi:hypothetical protein
MKTIIEHSKKYLDQMNLMDVSLLKVCMVSAGILIGISVPQKHKKKVAAGTSVIFALSYAPLMTKYLGVLLRPHKETID